MTVVTLTTDFGSGDHEAGVLKGVIWGIAPFTQIADLSHEIPAHDILDAALLLQRAVPYFPDGSIHVAIVDPGVGTARRAIAARIDRQYFVGPDNGLVSLVLARAEEKGLPTSVIQLDRGEFWLPEVSNVFHGRDIFAPAGGHLAAGVPLDALGTYIDDPICINVPTPEPSANGWYGQVIHIDHFGNLGTNLTSQLIQKQKEVVIKVKGTEIDGLVSTFGEKPEGSLIALLDSSGSIAISIVNGSAAQVLQAIVGDKIFLGYK